VTKPTLVVRNTCTYTEFQKVVKRHPSKEIDEFDVILFHIY